VFDSLRRFGGLDAFLANLQPVWECGSQVVGDQIEHEVGGDATDAAMFGLAHGPVLLALTEDAFDHRPA
jgi:hypothetical protein